MNAVVRLAGGKASQVINAMCDGLLAAAKSRRFRVNMDTFGNRHESGRPEGCAATCTVMKLADREFVPEEICSYELRAEAADLPDADLLQFEKAADHFREGRPAHLLRLCKVPQKHRPLLHDPWLLENGNWRKQLPRLRQFSRQLAQVGY